MSKNEYKILTDNIVALNHKNSCLSNDNELLNNKIIDLDRENKLLSSKNIDTENYYNILNKKFNILSDKNSFRYFLTSHHEVESGVPKLIINICKAKISKTVSIILYPSLLQLSQQVHIHYQYRLRF